jgi:hypothetical protein
LELSTKTPFEGAHFTVVRLVVVTHKVQQPVQNQAMQIRFETETPGSAGLIIRGFGRDQNVAQVSIITTKGQHIRRLVKSSIGAIVLPHAVVVDENHGKIAILNIQRRCQPLQKMPDVPAIDSLFALSVNHEECHES